MASCLRVEEFRDDKYKHFWNILQSQIYVLHGHSTANMLHSQYLVVYINTEPWNWRLFANDWKENSRNRFMSCRVNINSIYIFSKIMSFKGKIRNK